MKKSVMIIALLIGFLGFSFNYNNLFTIPNSGKSYHAIEGNIDRLVMSTMGKKVPGLTVAISKNGRMIYSKGFGYANYEQKIPMKRNFRSFIGSVSKIFTAWGVMKLTEENPSFDLNKKLYFNQGIFSHSDYKNAAKQGAKKHGTPLNWYKDMRVKHLLSHTVGYGWSGDRNGAAEMFGMNPDDLTYGQIHQYMLADRKVETKPGTAYDYSNHAVGLCGHLIHTVTGVPYGKYIDKKLLMPVGLSGKVVKNKNKPDQYSAYPHRYDSLTNKIVTLKWEEEPGGLNKVSAAGGWAASAESLIQMMVATDQLPNHKDVLKKSTIDLMETRPFQVSGSHAIGWGYSNGGKKLSHGGKIRGGRAVIVKFKKGYKLNGIDLSDINVAICANINSVKGIYKLADEIAKVAGQANIPNSYDLLKNVPGSFMGVWSANSKKDRVWVGANWRTFQSKWEGFAKDGYRLVDLDTYTENGRQLYNGVWEKGTGKHALYQFNSWDKFVDKWKELNKEGLRLIDIESFKSGNKRYYVGAWRKGSGKSALFQYDSWGKFVKKWKDLNNENQLLLDVETFKVGNKRFYVGVWGKGNGKKALFQFDNWDSFKKEWSKLNRQGQRLIDVETFKAGGKRYYVGVWREGNYKQGLWHEADWNHFNSKREDFAKGNQYLVDMERF